MRWKTSPGVPKAGDFRCRSRFAWMPLQIGDRTVWLERYGYEEEFVFPSGFGVEAGWWRFSRRYLIGGRDGL
jgi:hypothetical protein